MNYERYLASNIYLSHNILYEPVHCEGDVCANSKHLAKSILKIVRIHISWRRQNYGRILTNKSSELSEALFSW